jgi:endonuclease/exonuclease/phosphatase family metal-dependent hydrolase
MPPISLFPVSRVFSYFSDKIDLSMIVQAGRWHHALFSSILLLFTLSACQENARDTDLNLPPVFTPLTLPADYVDHVGDTLTVLSWNVEHFVDAYDSPYISNSREDDADSSRVTARTRMLADAIRQVDADVVVLQEFESAQLAKVIADSLLSDLHYDFVADAESPDWYMNVVVMSRAPLGLSFGYGNIFSPLTYTNKAGEQVTETQRMINTRIFTTEVIPSEDYRFLLTGVHLKAGGGNRNVAMRLGQLELIAQQLERIGGATGISDMLITGDFNAYPDGKEIGYITEEAGLAFRDPLPPEVVTHPADSPYRRLDYILINESMMDEYVESSLEVPYLFDTTRQSQVSDHLPVMADFLISR